MYTEFTIDYFDTNLIAFQYDNGCLNLKNTVRK